VGACVCGVVVVLCGFKSNVAVKYSRVFFGGRPVGPRSYLDSDTGGDELFNMGQHSFFWPRKSQMNQNGSIKTRYLPLSAE